MSEEVNTKAVREILERHDINDAPRMTEELRILIMSAFSNGYDEGVKADKRELNRGKLNLPNSRDIRQCLNNLEFEPMSLTRTLQTIQSARESLNVLSDSAYGWRTAYYDLKRGKEDNSKSAKVARGSDITQR